METEREFKTIQHLASDSIYGATSPPPGVTQLAYFADAGVGLYYDSEKDTYVVAHRGTWELKDAIADTHLISGTLLNTEFFKRRVDATLESLRLVPAGKPVILTGHSLGGTTATYALNNDSIDARVSRVVTYNPGSSPFMRPNTSFRGSDPSKVLNIRRTPDVVSAFATPGRTITSNQPIPLRNYVNTYIRAPFYSIASNLLVATSVAAHGFA
jgi:pimeloyl-ACP methyl ester carboxylesterase